MTSSSRRCIVCGRLEEVGYQYVNRKPVPVCRAHDEYELAAYWYEERRRSARRGTPRV